MTCQMGWAELTYLSDSTILTTNSWVSTLYRNLFGRRSPVKKKIYLFDEENKLPFFLFPFLFLFLFLFSDICMMCTFLFQYGA